MPDILNVTKWVKIHPSWLGTDLKTNIKKSMDKTLKGTCEKDIGYFVEILSVVSLNDSRIENSSSDISINVTFKVSVFKPVIGKVISVKILYLYNEGILISYDNFLKLIIPCDTYNEHNHKEQDVVQVEITDIKYDDKQFKCIARLV